MARLEPVELEHLGFFSRLFFGRSMIEAANMGSHTVDDRLKTLASLRTSMLAGCPH